MKLLLQTLIWFVIAGIPAIMASKRILVHKSGFEALLWLAFVWLVPLLGAFGALFLLKPVESRKA